MELPDNVKFKGVLVQGGAFKAKITSHKDQYPRFYFILNINPQADTVLVLSSTTTDFHSHKFCKGGDKVHITLSRKDYAPLYKNCLICCDRPQKIEKDKLEKELHSQSYELLPPLSEGVMQKIIQGISNSPVVEVNVKASILGNG